MNIYQIRKKSEPTLYLRGTPTYHSFHTEGRIFKLSAIRTFLTNAMKRRSCDISDWEVVEIEMVVKEVKGVHEVVSPKTIIKLLSK